MVKETQRDGAPRRVMLLITTLAFGGAETQVVRLATDLKAQGWAVAVVCLVAPSAYAAALRSTGIEVHSLDMPRGVPDPRAIIRFRSLVRSFRPDIVHSHMVHANLFARIARLFCPFPALICTAHNVREMSEKGGGTWHKELTYRATDFLADVTTIICRAGFDRYIRIGAVPARKLQIVPNGVDTHHFCPSAESRSVAREALNVQCRFVWLSVGRLVKQKDFPTLFRAFRRLDRADSILLIAGGGPLAGELRRECSQLGLTERVRFCGAREDIRNLYQAADAFVLASAYEGLSAALLEASSMGLPCVATDVGGNAEIVLNGVTGHLVPPHDPIALSAAMRSLTSASEAQRAQFGAAARTHCWTNFRFEAIVRRWTDLYGAYVRPAPSPSPAVENSVSQSCLRA